MPEPTLYDGQTFPGWLFPEHEPMGTNQSRGLTLDSGRQLFLDNFGIYSGEWHPALSPQGLSRTWHQAQKHPANPLIVPDRPWEHMVYLYGDVLYDQATGQWHMWYTNNDFGGPLQQGAAPFDFFSLQYAISRDGIVWEKPRLGLVQRAGQDTNVVINGYGQELKLGAHNVVEDAEAGDPSRRYRMLLNWIKRNPGQGPDPRSGFYQYFSPDGLHWDLSQGKRIVPVYQDSPGVFFKDRGRWLMFIRPRMVDRRLILIISEDGETWQPVGNILEPDLEDGLGNEPYVVGIRPYGCGYIMLVSLFQHFNNSRVDHHLYWSRNLLVWHRCNRPTPIIPLGPAGSWDSEVQYSGDR
ncbi:MAG: hypothetical protein EXR62_03035 [Chloroflexi bacterium]|nr:hypothetical protein [Chloroflexota bacterium]